MKEGGSDATIYIKNTSENNYVRGWVRHKIIKWGRGGPNFFRPPHYSFLNAIALNMSMLQGIIIFHPHFYRIPDLHGAGDITNRRVLDGVGSVGDGMYLL